MFFVAKTGFIKTTNQYWKYIGSILLSFVVGMVFLWQINFSNDVTIFKGYLSVITLMSLFLFIWGCYSIKCPKCKLRILWYSVSKLEH